MFSSLDRNYALSWNFLKTGGRLLLKDHGTKAPTGRSIFVARDEELLTYLVICTGELSADFYAAFDGVSMYTIVAQEKVTEGCTCDVRNGSPVSLSFYRPPKRLARDCGWDGEHNTQYQSHLTLKSHDQPDATAFAYEDSITWGLKSFSCLYRGA